MQASKHHTSRFYARTLTDKKYSQQHRVTLQRDIQRFTYALLKPKKIKPKVTQYSIRKGDRHLADKPTR